jgi:hypothetical protein
MGPVRKNNAAFLLETKAAFNGPQRRNCGYFGAITCPV